MPKRSLASAAPRLKLVIRRLPPNLPEELFWKAVAPWVTETTCTWKRFVKGRPAIKYASCSIQDTKVMTHV
jgi:regulator of nonsense transcripts 3